jgi:hypothetical protein
MEYISHREIASVNIFDLRLSEGELMVYESCINFVINNCNEKLLYSLTGCESKNELKDYQHELRTLIKNYVKKEYLPENYYDKD